MGLFFLHISLPDIIRSLVWCFFHSMWLALLVAIAIEILQFLLHKYPARSRYRIFRGIFGTLILLIVYKFFIELGKADFPLETTVVRGPGAALLLDQDNQQLAQFPLTRFITVFNKAAMYLFGIWLILYLFRVRLFFWKRASRRLRQQSTAITAGTLVSWLQQEKTALGIKPDIQLRRSEHVSSALVTGLRKPLIILPARLVEQFSEDQLQNIVLHELMHIRQKDHWFHTVQFFWETLFFFNPAFRWVSDALRQEQEARCDQQVIERTHDQKLYLTTLVSAYEYSYRSQTRFVSFLGRKYSVVTRVARILEAKAPKLNYLSLLCFAGGFCFLFFINPDFQSAPYSPGLPYFHHVPLEKPSIQSHPQAKRQETVSSPVKDPTSTSLPQRPAAGSQATTSAERKRVNATQQSLAERAQVLQKKVQQLSRSVAALGQFSSRASSNTETDAPQR